ncbi:MAG TPA: tetratricopeptide repeat protein, partial [Gammaproteobacteria bacterium]|nr:tetratricopeptide repeat protein [Gammaproteobacteria bacterium]
IAAYNTAQKKQQNNRIIYKLAKAYEELGDYKNSVITLEKWLQKNEKDLTGHIMLAQFHQNHKNMEKASLHYEQALKISPENLVALNNIAWIYAEQGNKQGVVYAKKAYDLMPNNPNVADTYGWALIQSGQIDKGVNIIKQASIVAPHILEIKYHLAYGYYKQGKKKQARTDLNRLLKNADFQLKAEAKALISKLD